jgi:glycerol uptake facilitator-like aquaporin
MALSRDAPFRAFLLEVIMTFFLVTIVFGVAIKAQHFPDDPRLEPLTAAFAALPISAAVVSMICIGFLTGTGINPARAIGPELLSNSWNRNSWLYYIGPMIGGAIAGLCYEFLLTKRRSSYWKPQGDDVNIQVPSKAAA